MAIKRICHQTRAVNIIRGCEPKVLNTFIRAVMFIQEILPDSNFGTGPARKWESTGDGCRHLKISAKNISYRLLPRPSPN